MRRPARLERAGALTPRDRIWAAIRGCADLVSRFSVADIMVMSAERNSSSDLVTLREDSVATYLTGLHKAGYLGAAYPTGNEIPPKLRCLRSYQLIRDVGVEAPAVGADGRPTRDGRDRQQMWTVARKYKGAFDRRMLAHDASVEGLVISDEQAKFFCRHLERAGYLQAGAKKPRVFTRYHFVRSRDSGPRAPVIGRDLSVLDGNSGTLMCEALR